MAKHMITRMWIWGAIVMTIGGTLAAAISFVMIAHVGDITAGNRVRFVPDDFFWTTIGLMTFGGIVAGVGYLLQLAAWIGAVFNANRLANKKWFRVLLWGGIVGYLVVLFTLSTVIGRWEYTAVMWPGYVVGGLIGWGIMLPYLIGGTGGMAGQHQQERKTPNAIQA
jgi:hypothetical protein